jgi:hypothetical protein
MGYGPCEYLKDSRICNPPHTHTELSEKKLLNLNEESGSDKK